MPKRLVVDASVVAKWFFAEVDFKIARDLVIDYSLLAPDLLFLEVYNVFWQRVRKGLLDQAEATVMTTALSKAGLHITSAFQLRRSAFDLACLYEQTMYDSTYLALALYEKVPFVTADQKLCRALATTSLAKSIIYLPDFSEQIAD